MWFDSDRGMEADPSQKIKVKNEFIEVKTDNFDYFWIISLGCSIKWRVPISPPSRLMTGKKNILVY